MGPFAVRSNRYRHSETRWTIANEQDPENKFKQKSGGVYAGLLPAMFATANTAFDWGSRKWTMVLSPLPVDPYSQVALITHEAFHRIQDAMTSQPPTSQMRIWTPRTDDSGFAWNCGHWRVRYGQRLTRICARASPTR